MYLDWKPKQEKTNERKRTYQQKRWQYTFVQTSRRSDRSNFPELNLS
jgi:hypothetical protein